MSGNTIDDVSGATGIRVYDPARKAAGSSELGKNEFLKVLVAQMANQNPLEPTSDTEFIAQMAQFSALEQMQYMNEAVQSQTAYGMIGKVVAATMVMDAQGNAFNQEVTGAVTGVTKLKNVEYLVVYDYGTSLEYLVPPSSVKTAFPGATAESSQLSVIAQLLEKIVEQTAKSENAQQTAANSEVE